MTSMPASRSARATTFAPRSWPSRPAFATTTRIGRLEIAGVDIRSVDLLQHRDLLADRRVCPRAFEEREHELASRLRSMAQLVERCAPAARISYVDPGYF